MTTTTGNGTIPPPSPGGRAKYPWASMGVSDYFTLPATATKPEKSAALSSAYNYAKRAGKKFCRRDQPDGTTRIYRET